jgi:hypothetical protein
MARNDRSRRWLFGLVALSLAPIIVFARSAPAQSDTGTSPWITPTVVANDLSDAVQPSLAFTRDGVEHAVWQTEGQIYYAAQMRGQGWDPPRRIASGMSPALVMDDFGQLHALYVNQFMGNYEIYDITLTNGEWSLPVNVSHTSGFSAFPAATAGSGGALYVAWMDNSPGYWTIYVGQWNGTYWSNQPIPNARGQGPTLGFSPDGALYLAWQDRVPTIDNPNGTFHIFFSERRNGVWTLPVDVSARPEVESIGVNLTTTSDGLAHLAWVDGGQEVRYGFGRGGYWPDPVTVMRAAAVTSGPRILSERSEQLHIAWDEGETVLVASAAPTTLSWPKPAVIAAPLHALRDVVLALGPGNEVSLGWIQTHQPQDVGIYESWQPSNITPRAWLPLIMR